MRIQSILRAAVVAALLVPAAVVAQESAPKLPQHWFHLDAQADKVPGISSDRAYNELLKGKKAPAPIIVAVIDGGVDVKHEDLQGHLWINTKEQNGKPGQDDDKNGYVDDIYGWNFIGGKDSQSVDYENLELVRELVRLEAKSDLTPDEQKYLDTLRQVQTRELAKYKQYLPQYQQIMSVFEVAKQAMSTDTITLERVQAWQPADERGQSIKNGLTQLFTQYGVTQAQIEEGYKEIRSRVEYNLNKSFDARKIVGDDPNDLTNRFYGNNDVIGPDASHGTHVAGIIAAIRDNNKGALGVADKAVRIMSIRAVPNGDERDKDVANAVRYAVDNGAKIINMSFGKDFVRHKQYVDEAFAYAEQKGVLVVHAAGNDSRDLDVKWNYPTRETDSGKNEEKFKNWLEVGASTGLEGKLAADFSNYGKQSVDIFAPGHTIYSLKPGNQYQNNQGTSMAAPVVSGVAAVVWANYPKLTALQVKDILLKSAVKYTDTQTDRPHDEEDGSKAAKTAFGELSKTGGVVNLYEALKLAASYQ